MPIRRTYLDYASAAPLVPKAARAYTKALLLFGNASAVHAEGRAAKGALEEARTAIARTFAVKPEELVFTSGGTESNNIAILNTSAKHCIASTIEHSSVLKAFGKLEARGVKITYLKPKADGLISAGDVLSALTPETGLVSLHHVNSETGTVQPIADIGRALKKKDEKIVFHVDAAQSPMWLDAGPHTLQADLVSYDAQKVGGPKGVGILYRDYKVAFPQSGGTQERGIRPGTENVPAIVAAASAFVEAAKGKKSRVVAVGKLRDLLRTEITKAVPSAEVLGSMKRRVANNLFIAIPGVDGDYLAVLMDKAGVAVSPRSACIGSGTGYSQVALELTHDMGKAKGTIRFTLGPDTKRADIVRAVRALARAILVTV
ncbi:MAG: cysteine desulfurase family protein [Patescibacteria group bacterium]